MNSFESVAVDSESGLPIGQPGKVCILPTVRQFYIFIATSYALRKIFPSIESFAYHIAHLVDAEDGVLLEQALYALQDETVNFDDYDEEQQLYIAEMNTVLYAKSLRKNFSVFLKDGNLHLTLMEITPRKTTKK